MKKYVRFNAEKVSNDKPVKMSCFLANQFRLFMDSVVMCLYIPSKLKVEWDKYVFLQLLTLKDKAIKPF